MEDLNGIIKDMERLHNQMDVLFEQVVSVLRRVSESSGQLEIGETKKRPQRSNPKATYFNNFARNTDMLRIECNFSYDDLANASGIDKRTILRHVNKGMQPRPRMMKRYAETFSAALGRIITVSDLQK